MCFYVWVCSEQNTASPFFQESSLQLPAPGVQLNKIPFSGELKVPEDTWHHVGCREGTWCTQQTLPELSFLSVPLPPSTRGRARRHSLCYLCSGRPGAMLPSEDQMDDKW